MNPLKNFEQEPLQAENRDAREKCLLLLDKRVNVVHLTFSGVTLCQGACGCMWLKAE